MKTQLLKTFSSYGGGTNNLNVVHVVNDRLQILKTFTSLISVDKAEKRAMRYQNKLEYKNVNVYYCTKKRVQ